ncbi:hypothetical protein Patl1_02312 [Pistacia atlantica]|uniref:Uncharacterized protein n=1 Tax=Pistacia atlantica TaxID=434234 RepID=A0ACC1CA11_9ROSI|nr:hypothetical protein Patl1_02312 [Pistacia atlantica]
MDTYPLFNLKNSTFNFCLNPKINVAIFIQFLSIFKVIGQVSLNFCLYLK